MEEEILGSLSMQSERVEEVEEVEEDDENESVSFVEPKSERDRSIVPPSESKLDLELEVELELEMKERPAWGDREERSGFGTESRPNRQGSPENGESLKEKRLG